MRVSNLIISNNIKLESKFTFCLVIAYIGESLFAKSMLSSIPFIWAIHMAVSIAITILIIFIFIRSKLYPINKFAINIRKGIAVVVIFIGLWGIISAIFQLNSLSELLYIISWELMVIACFFAAPRLLIGFSSENIIKYANYPLKIAILASVLLAFTITFDPLNSRFNGILGSVPAMGEVSMLCALLTFCQILFMKSKRKYWNIALFIASLALLLLTRSRMPNVSLITAVLIIWLLNSRSKSNPLKFTIIFSTFFLVFIYFNEANPILKTNFLQFLRFQEESSSLFDTRTPLWNSAYTTILKNPILGTGFTSRFSESGGMGISARIKGDNSNLFNPGLYDPHNFYLSFGKSLGIPGLILSIVLVIYIIRMAIIIIFNYKYYNNIDLSILLGFCIIITILTITSDPLISFGDIFDRYCWLFLGVFSVRYRSTSHPKQVFI